MRAFEGLTVIGTGTVAVPVDRVEISLAVEVLRPDAGDAFRAASGSVAAVLSALADGGVDSRSVRTADLHLGPRTQYRDNREEFLGYACGQRLVANVAGLERLPRLLGDLATTGVEGVRFEGISFSASDTAQPAAEARRRAVADAREKAEHYAGLTGRVLGRVRSLTESIRSGGPVPMVAMAKRELAAAMPVAGGTADITVTVEVRFAFADAVSGGGADSGG